MARAEQATELKFVVTNTLIVQGLIFVLTPQMRQRMARLLGLLRRGPMNLLRQARQQAQLVQDSEDK